MICSSRGGWIVKNNHRIDFETTKGTKIAKIQSTENTEQTESLAAVALPAKASVFALSFQL